MNNLEFLFMPKKLRNLKKYLKGNKLVFTYYPHETKYLDSIFIKTLIEFMNDIINFIKSTKISVELNIRPLIFKDKLVYIIFECICFYILKYTRANLILNFYPDDLLNELEKYIETYDKNLLRINNSETNRQKFIDNFYNYNYSHKFRKIAEIEKHKKNQFYLSGLNTDIDSFLKVILNNDNDTNYRNKVSMVISELIGNALEHSQSDCLVDIDFWIDKKERVIQIVLLNFSNNIMGQLIQEKLEKSKGLSDRYLKLKDAYCVHKDLCFNQNIDYIHEDFYKIACFQHQISGRVNRRGGGTGLTQLIRLLNSIQHTSKDEWCYMMSGNKCIRFYKELINFNDDGWLGFNKTNDFLENIPDENVIHKSGTYLSGVAYNLVFSI